MSANIIEIVCNGRGQTIEIEKTRKGLKHGKEYEKDHEVSGL